MEFPVRLYITWTSASSGSLPSSFLPLFSPPLLPLRLSLTMHRCHSCEDPCECFCGHDLVFTLLRVSCIIASRSSEVVRTPALTLLSLPLATEEGALFCFVLFCIHMPFPPYHTLCPPVCIHPEGALLIHHSRGKGIFNLHKGPG